MHKATKKEQLHKEKLCETLINSIIQHPFARERNYDVIKCTKLNWEERATAQGKTV
jgi:hypothetical protein